MAAINVADEKLKQLIRMRSDAADAKDNKTEEAIVPPENDAIAFQQWFLQQFQVPTSTAAKSTGSNNNNNQVTLEDFAVYLLNALRQHGEAHLRATDGETSNTTTPVRGTKPISVTATTEERQNLPADGSATRRRLSIESEHSVKSMDISVSSVAAEDNPQLDNSQLDNSQLSNQSGISNRPQLATCSNNSTPVRRPKGNNNNQQRRGGDQSNSTPNSSNYGGNRNGATSKSPAAGRCLGDFIVTTAVTPGGGRSSQRQKKLTLSPLLAEGPQKKRVALRTVSPQSIGHEKEVSPFGVALNPFVSSAEEKSTLLEMRKKFKQNLIEIGRDSKATADAGAKPEAVTVTAAKPHDDNVAEQQVLVDLNMVTNRDVIQTIANIYAALIDMNFVTNVLNEISFVINLFNAPITPNKMSTKALIAEILQLKLTNDNMSLNVLDSSINCFYFALLVLQQQKQVLMHLDLKSLGVLLQSDRLRQLAPDLYKELRAVTHQKQKMLAEQQSQGTRTHTGRCQSSHVGKSFQNVYYQEKYDSREHFTSNSEFGAFKTQRDLFYKSLKLWEENHLNPLQNMPNKLIPVISDIFRLSESPVNMTHFAKLFVAQLLISASNATSPEEIGLENAAIDQQKLSKLTQRLVAPSNYSVDYQFPRNQAFFRDFIVHSRSLAFVEQLKIALYSEVIVLNDSTFEQFNLYASLRSANADDADEVEENGEDAASSVSGKHVLIVRPDILASMMLLAKFLGFATAIPFAGSDEQYTAIEKKQIWLREHFLPNFDACRLIDDAVRDGKQLITLPWLVQYLIMLDNVTLQLKHFVQVLNRLYTMYAQCACNHASKGGSTISVATFILRFCLGWLFEKKPITAQQYYNYRKMNAICGGVACVCGDLNSQAVAVLPQASPLLESLLSVSCPFLAEFRVAIMPAMHAQSKRVSRATGCYRYITLSSVENVPNVHEIPPVPEWDLVAAITKANEQQHVKQTHAQRKLIEAFLHAQNVNMRRLIDFISERAYKSVVKDGQLQILLPSKAAADSKVNEITSFNFCEVATAVGTIYKLASQVALEQWQKSLPQSICERTESALDALLPTDTKPIIKHTYKQLIFWNAMHKVHQWTYTNMIKSQSFYCSNLQDVAQKICKSNSKSAIDNTLPTVLVLVKETPSLSGIIDDLQYWLHCTSTRNDLCTDLPMPIIDLLKRILSASDGNKLPATFYRQICTSLIILLQNMIANVPYAVSTELLQIISDVFILPPMVEATKTPPSFNNDYGDIVMCDNEFVDDDEYKCPTPDRLLIPETSLNLYEALVTVPFINCLGARRESYDKLHLALVALICGRVITTEFVNKLFVGIFKVDWEASALNEISLMLRHVAKATAHMTRRGANGNDGDDQDYGEGSDDRKSHLFMEVLADFSSHVDDF